MPRIDNLCVSLIPRPYREPQGKQKKTPTAAAWLDDVDFYTEPLWVVFQSCVAMFSMAADGCRHLSLSGTQHEKLPGQASMAQLLYPTALHQKAHH